MLNQRHAINAVKCHQIAIVNDLVVDYILDHLVVTEVFTERERQFILRRGEALGDVSDVSVRDRILRLQNETFVDMLLKKMETIDHTFTSFTYILFKDDNYPWIAKRLLSLRDEERRMEDMNNCLHDMDINGLPKRFEVIDQCLRATIGKPLEISLYLYDRDNNLVAPDPWTHVPKISLQGFNIKDNYKLDIDDKKLIIKNIIIIGEIEESQMANRETKLEIFMASINWTEELLIELIIERSNRPKDLCIDFLMCNGIQELNEFRLYQQKCHQILVKLQELGEDLKDLKEDFVIETILNGYKRSLIELKTRHMNRPIRGAVAAKAPQRNGVIGRIAHLAYVEDHQMAAYISWFLRYHMTCIVTKTTESAETLTDTLCVIKQTLPLDSIPEHGLHSPQLPSNPSISVVFAKNYLKYNQKYENLDKVFAAILGNTLIIEDMEIAKKYRNVVIKETICPTIITKTGILYDSGIIDKSLPIDIVMFQSPQNPELTRVENIVDLLQQLLFLIRKDVNEYNNCQESRDYANESNPPLVQSPVSRSTSLNPDSPESARKKRKNTV